MSMQSTYDEILEDQECLICGAVGMESDGGFDYVCPNCEYEGTLVAEGTRKTKSTTDAIYVYIR